MQVDIEKIKSDKKNADKVEKQKEKRETKILMKVRKQPINDPPRFKPQNIILQRQIEPPCTELNQGVKGSIIKLLSLPAGTRKEIFEQKLKESRYINEYVEAKLCVRALDKLNADGKFLALYCYNYIESLK